LRHIRFGELPVNLPSFNAPMARRDWRVSMLKLHTFADCTIVTAPPRQAGIARHFANVLAGIRDGGAMHDRYQQLSRMSNTDLARRGLSRQDITRAVVKGE